MSWLQLDPPTHAARIRASVSPVAVPSLATSLTRGTLGFTVVSVVSFLPWVLYGRELAHRFGEAGLYSICALLFMGLSAPALHRLILGPGSLARFYQLFSVAFFGYAIAWILCYMAVRGHWGGGVGLLAGSVIMAWIFAVVFRSPPALVPASLALFLGNAAGYFLGGIFEGYLLPMHSHAGITLPIPHTTQILLAKLQWGICYGAGFGAGLGIAFHLCQARVRTMLVNPTTHV